MTDMAAVAQKYDHLFKMLLIGNTGVGKTCLLERCSEGRFRQDVRATIGIDFKIKYVQVGRRRIKLQIWDTAGISRFRHITTSYFRGVHGVIVVYDVTGGDSFENIKTDWMKVIEMYAPPETPVMILGNKCDSGGHCRPWVISEEKGKLLAAEYGALFMEVSAKTGHNVERAFVKMSRELVLNMDLKKSCTDCLNPSNDPKLLKCFHTCCKICVGQVEPIQCAITCPICQHITPLPASGMSALPAAFHTRHLHFIQERLKKIEESPKPVCEKCMKKRFLATRYCRQCSKFICEACCKVHEDWDALKYHKILSIDEVKRRAKCLIPLEEPQLCEKHGEKLKLYCETCQELICVHCTIQVHKEHTHCVIADTIEPYKQEMLNSLEPVKKQLKDINHTRHAIQDMKEEVSQQKKEIEINIQSSFQQLHKMLEQHEARLIANSEKLFNQKIESLNSLEDEAVNSYCQGKSCVHVITESVRTGSQEEVMTTKNLLLMQVNEFSEMLKDKSLEVPEQSLANTGFAFCQNLEKILGEEIGCIYQARVSLNRVVTLEKRAKFGLDICDDNNQPCSLPTSAIQTRLVCGSTNEETLHVITELDRGRYEIACQPTTPGLHTLEVKVHGRPVRRSPFAVRVIQSLDTPVRMIEGLNGPRGVAVNSKGEVIVCEADAKCVSIFSSTGERIKVFEGKMTNDRPLGTVHGVAVDQSDKILVLDSDHCLVHVFSPEGRQLNSMGRLGISCQSIHLTSPNGICVHRSTGSQYIVDRLGHCVHILAQNKHGVGDVRSQQFGSRGSGNGQFNSPCDIACDSAGDVYVSDTDNHRIQVFTPDGCYLRQFGKEGSGPGELNGPIGICIDSADIVYVGELHNKRISVLTTDGEWIKCFGCEGSGPGQFDGVFGMTIDHSGVLYVSDYGNKRVQMF